MKRNLFLFSLWCTMSLSLFQCEGNDEPSPNSSTLSCAQNPDVCKLGEATNQFGFDIFKKLNADKPDDNLFISPLSISSALSMTLNGANGKTKEEMLKVLGAGKISLDELNQSYQTLLKELPNLDPKVKVDIANSIWYRQGFAVNPAFLNTNTTYYNSEVRPLDFSKPDAKDIINKWVSDKTNKLIPSIIDQIQDNSVMFLINAIYFKGTWRRQFDTKKTYDGDFTTEKNVQVPVKMMSYGNSLVKLSYFSNDKLHAVKLPYADSVYSMTVILPKEGFAVKDILPELTLTNWNSWNKAYSAEEIFFALPKFSLRYENSLNASLEALGMPTAFIPSQADFSGIATGQELSISNVKHKAFIEVDEAGTKAAAATSVEIVVTSVPNNPQFIVNRPFIFVISESRTNQAIFIGKMMNPTSDK
ncbi:serpin family protein [Haliscomenobacter hydrossis]|uniref:Proteinase inhibitor I4 serpin n=1 Tax=Haliscomenobacter hydrossis (strain ATCC 27775 / DSM 1100 / LMG 10767 / O) TaxID=760192 RepID=F4L5I9_HALH1|nr:serpin family protein [Haliscomenobacter hydrossis]AEE50853.1 proteinase inhibitor I4 serpin [Haliscomenobacter hydrossis DSM 1100]